MSRPHEDAIKPVAENHRFNEDNLAKFMRANVDGFSFAEKTGRE